MRVRRGVCPHPPSLTRESLLSVSETYAKRKLRKMSQLESCLTVDVVEEFYSVATVPVCLMNTVHQLCHHQCFLPASFLSLFTAPPTL